MEKVIVIGSGFASLSAAIHLADKGFDVTILEKNTSAGGRARAFKEQGFTFDMGPSWYWMPEVFENFFNQFDKSVTDYYNLIRLDPSYQVIFGEDDFVAIPAAMSKLEELFEKYERGSKEKLKAFLNQAEYKYKTGMNDFVWKPSLTFTEFLNPKYFLDAWRLQIFEPFSSHARRFFENKKLLQLIEFPILFLGALPENTPALYSLMNYADMVLGTWYPMGGMHQIIASMVALAKEKGAEIKFNEEVKSVEISNGEVKKVLTNNNSFNADILINGGDYHHFETEILSEKYRSYSEKYWKGRVLAPSALIFFLGIDKKLQNLLHHNLFFDTDFVLHAKEIYETHKWPTEPLFYVSVPSVTDPTVAPDGYENVFILIPVATDLNDNEETREKYYHMVMDRLERLTGQNIRGSVVFKRSYAHKDFKKDYYAFRGNAYGLANTLMQTAILKPRMKSKKVKNLYHTGQLTVPGPGVPPSLISGAVVAREVIRKFQK